MFSMYFAKLSIFLAYLHKESDLYQTTYVKDRLPQAIPNRQFVISVFQTLFSCKFLKLIDVNVVIILNFIVQS